MELTQIFAKINKKEKVTLDEKLSWSDFCALWENSHKEYITNLKTQLLYHENDPKLLPYLEVQLKNHPEDWEMVVESLDIPKIKSVYFDKGKFRIPENMILILNQETQQLVDNKELASTQEFIINVVYLVPGTFQTYRQEEGFVANSSIESIFKKLFPQIEGETARVAMSSFYGLLAGLGIVTATNVLSLYLMEHAMKMGNTSDQHLAEILKYAGLIVGMAATRAIYTHHYETSTPAKAKKT